MQKLFTPTHQDRNLIERIVQKDERAIMELYNLHHRGVRRYIEHQLNDSHIAEELVQDVFLDFIDAVRDFHYQCSLKTFIYTIARNKTIDMIRKKKIKKILFSALPSYVVENLTSVLFDDQMEKKEVSQKIHSVLSSLPNDYQLILRLKYMDGVRVKAIAQKLSLGFKATESLLFRARKSFIKAFHKMA